MSAAAIAVTAYLVVGALVALVLIANEIRIPSDERVISRLLIIGLGLGVGVFWLPALVVLIALRFLFIS